MTYTEQELSVLLPLAKRQYIGYGNKVGWKNYQGNPMPPTWEDLTEGVQNGWLGSAKETLEYLGLWEYAIVRFTTEEGDNVCVSGGYMSNMKDMRIAKAMGDAHTRLTKVFNIYEGYEERRKAFNDDLEYHRKKNEALNAKRRTKIKKVSNDPE